MAGWDDWDFTAGTEFQVNPYTTGAQGEDIVRRAADGRFVVTWEADGRDGDQEGIFAQRHEVDGTRLGDDEGAFVVTWTDAAGQDGSGAGIFGRRWDTQGAPAGTEFRVNSFTTGAQINSRLACNPRGDFVVAREDLDGIDRLVLDARAAGGKGWKKRGNKGFRCRQRSGAPEGLTAIDLRAGATGKAQGERRVDGPPRRAAFRHLLSRPPWLTTSGRSWSGCEPRTSVSNVPRATARG